MLRRAPTVTLDPAAYPTVNHVTQALWEVTQGLNDGSLTPTEARARTRALGRIMDERKDRPGFLIEPAKDEAPVAWPFPNSTPPAD